MNIQKIVTVLFVTLAATSVAAQNEQKIIFGNQSDCIVATVLLSGEVSINWRCAEERAKFVSSPSSATLDAVIAHMLISVHNGNYKTMER